MPRRKNSKDTARGCGCLLALVLLLAGAVAHCSGDDEYASPGSPGAAHVTASPAPAATGLPTARPKLPKLTCKNVDREYDRASDESDEWDEDFRSRRLDKIIDKMDRCAPEPEEYADDGDDSRDDGDADGDDDVDVPDWLCPTRFC